MIFRFLKEGSKCQKAKDKGEFRAYSATKYFWNFSSSNKHVVYYMSHILV